MEQTINPVTIDNIYEQIMEASSTTLHRNVQISWQELQNQAKRFLEGYEILKNQADALAELLLHKSIFTEPDFVIAENQKVNQKQKLILQSKYLLAARFDEYLNIFRESLPSSMIYVYEAAGAQLSSYEMTFKDLIKYADKEGSLSISKATLEQDKRRKMEDFIDVSHINDAKQAYEGVYNRLERFYEVTRKERNEVAKAKAKAKGKKDISKVTATKQGALLLWKEGRRWQRNYVLNYGDVKEAYFDYLMAEHQNNLTCGIAKGESPYYNHEFIKSFYENYITKVGSLAAIIEEDVVTAWAQYGIKSAGAHLPSLDMYERAAEWIVKQKEGFSKEELENELKSQNPPEVKRNITLSIKEANERLGAEVVRIALRVARRDARG